MLGLSVNLADANIVNFSKFAIAPLDSNIKCLLDAKVTNSIFTTGGGGIFRWKDQTINENDATQSIVASQPTVGTSFSQPGIKIDNTDDFMVIPFTLDWTNQPFTIIAVGTKLSTTGFRGLISNRFGAGAADWWTLGQNSPSTMVVERTGGNLGLNYAFNAQGQSPQIYEFSHDPTGNSLLHRNGTLIDTALSNINIGGLTNELRIGRWFTATQGWDGFIMEIQVRTELFDAAKRASVTAGLAAKWQ